MDGVSWKTLLKWMIWGENPLFAETYMFNFSRKSGSILFLSEIIERIFFITYKSTELDLRESCRFSAKNASRKYGKWFGSDLKECNNLFQPRNKNVKTSPKHTIDTKQTNMFCTWGVLVSRVF